MKKHLNRFFGIFILINIFICLFTLTACNKEKNYEIHFFVDDNVYATVSTSGDEVIQMPQNPSKDGFIFDGWYLDKDVWEQPFTASSLLDSFLSSDMSVYAKFIDDNDLKGTEIDLEGFREVNKGTLGKCYYISLPNSCNSFSFNDAVKVSSKSKWELSADSKGEKVISSKIVELNIGDNYYYITVTDKNNNFKIHPVCVRRRPIYTITFNLDNGSPNIIQHIEEEHYVDVVDDPVKTGYTFDIWSLDFSEPVMSNMYIKAIYTPNTYTVTYDANGGEISKASQDVTFDNNETLITPTREGYAFTGWYYGTSKIGNIWEIADDVTLTAHWEIIEYTIAYNLDGGTSTNHSSYTVEDTITLKEPTKLGYTFEGWTYDGQETPQKEIIINKGSTENKEFTANWLLTKYDIVYNLDGGTVTNPSNYTVLDTITIENPTRLGYIFEGWTYDEQNVPKKEVVIAKGSTGNKELTAHWEIIEYTIAYNLDGGTSTDPSSYTVEDTIKLEEPTKLGYAFVGWTYANQDVPQKEMVIAKGSTENKEFTAHWEITEHTITYCLDDGENSPKNPTTFTIENLDFILNIPRKADYEFIGWYLEPEYITEITKITELKDYIIYAKFIGYSHGLEFKKIDNSYTVVGYTGTDNDVRIPKKYEGLPVTAIGENAFKDCLTLHSVDMPSTIINICDDAFKGCSNLLSVTIPKQVLSIGARAFNDSGLVSVIFEEGTQLKEIGGAAFAGCNSLTGIKLPSTITKLAEQTFYESSALKSITIPETITEIGVMCFEGCIALKEVVFEEGSQLEKIGIGAFIFCDLTSFTLPKNCVILENSILNGNYNLKYINVEEGNEKYYALQNCIIEKGTNKLIVGSCLGTIPNDVIEIDYAAFCGRNFLYFHMPSSVEIIGDYAFAKTNLEEINFSKNIKQIGEGAFVDCSKLTKITVDIDNPVFKSEGNCLLSKDGKNLIFGCNTSIIPNTVTNIQKYAFQGCINLKSITIPDGVTSIGYGAFYGCSSLTSIVIPNSVTTMEYDIFYGCSGLTSITIGSGITELDFIFRDCKNLENIKVDIGNTVYKSEGNCILTKDGTTLVLGCKNSIIPNGVTSIGDNAFRGCSNLTSIVIPNSVKNIGNWAFDGCSDLTSIVLSNSVVGINYGAFNECSSLKNIYYIGTEADWNNMTINNEYDYNDNLLNATKYYYSETEPINNGKYWHYDTDGNTPVIWVKK